MALKSIFLVPSTPPPPLSAGMHCNHIFRHPEGGKLTFPNNYYYYRYSIGSHPSTKELPVAFQFSLPQPIDHKMLWVIQQLSVVLAWANSCRSVEYLGRNRLGKAVLAPQQVLSGKLGWESMSYPKATQ